MTSVGHRFDALLGAIIAVAGNLLIIGLLLAQTGIIALSTKTPIADWEPLPDNKFH